MPVTEVSSPSDPIVPTKIEHHVDEGYEPGTGKLLFHYNYFVYQFGHPAGAIGARSYLDEPNRVSIFVPEGVGLEDPILRHIIEYLRRRYSQIQRLGPKGYEPVPLEA